MPPSDLAAWLAQDRWLRRLARRLVRDDAAAEDLVQETWVRALASGGAARSPRTWLAGVLRHLRRDRVRGDGRRERREREAGGSRADAVAPDDLVAEIELRRRLSEALLALEEPYRSTLVRRFFREESLTAIARHDGLALSTVHQRLERGLARLRARLDDEHGGRREAWALGMAALARPWSTKTILETLVMAGTTKVAASLLVAGGVLAWWWTHEGHAPVRLAAEGPAPAAEHASPGPLEPVPVGASRSSVPASAVAVDTAAAGPAAAESIPGRVVASDGGALGGVEVGWLDAEAEDAVSGPDGRFRLAAAPGGRYLHVTTAGLTTLVHGVQERASGERVVVAAPAADFAGRVVDARGEPLPGAWLAFRLRGEIFARVGVEPLGLRGEVPGWSTTADADGRFALPGLAGGPGVCLEVRADQHRREVLDLAASGDPALEIVLQPLSGVVQIHGLVLGPDGRPVAGARVSAGQEVVVSDADGGFVLEWDGGNGRVFRDAEGVWREEGAELAGIIAVKEGLLPDRVALAGLDLDELVVLTLGPAPLSISGRVVDGAGRTRPDVVLWVSDPTRFFEEDVSVGGVQEFQREHTVEGELCGTRQLGAVSDREGRFEISCLMERTYQVAAHDPATAQVWGTWEVRAGTRGLELSLPEAEDVRRVAGVLRSFSGRPIEGVKLQPVARPVAERGEDPPALLPEPEPVRTDAEGRFVFERLATRGTQLLLEHERLLFRWVALDDHPDPEHLELLEPLLCEVQVDASGTPGLADEARFLDPDQEPLEALEVVMSDKVLMASLTTVVTLADGRSSVLRVPESAATIVYLADGVEVLRRPVTLDPERRTTLQP